MRKTFKTAIVLTCAALLLSSCSKSEETIVQTNKTKAPRQSSLKVPESSDSKTIAITLEGKHLPIQTEGKLYAYGGTWDEPRNCTGKGIEATFTTKDESDIETSITVPQPGVYTIMMSLPGYSSKCADPKSIVRVRSATKLSFSTGVDTLTTRTSNGTPSVSKTLAGKPFGKDIEPINAGNLFKFRVAAEIEKNLPLPKPIDVTVKLMGPFKDRPATEAKTCEDSPVAIEVSTSIDVNGNYQEINMTPTKSGEYRLVAKSGDSKDVQSTVIGCSPKDATYLTVN